MALLRDLCDFLKDDGVSRRAVYNSFEWLKDLPQDQPAMLASLLAYQLARQADDAACKSHNVAGLARSAKGTSARTIDKNRNSDCWRKSRYRPDLPRR